MIFNPGSTKVFLAPGATDMRKAINGLSLLVADQLELDPLSGHMFCFCNRKKDIVKVLYWDRNGFCLWHKRLEKDRFRWPESEDEVLSLDIHQLRWLLDGLEWEQSQAHRQIRYKETG